MLLALRQRRTDDAILDLSGLSMGARNCGANGVSGQGWSRGSVERTLVGAADRSPRYGNNHCITAHRPHLWSLPFSIRPRIAPSRGPSLFPNLHILCLSHDLEIIAIHADCLPGNISSCRRTQEQTHERYVVRSHHATQGNMLEVVLPHRRLCDAFQLGASPD